MKQKQGQNLKAEITKLQKLSISYFFEHENERNKTAQDIHDLIGQQLAAVNIQLKLIESGIEDPGQKEHIEELEMMISRSIASAREMINRISPRVIYEQSLRICLKWLADYFNANHFLAVSLSLPKDLSAAGNDLQAFLFRSLYAILMNVVMHSGKKEVKIHVEKTDTDYHFRIQDHGKGFDVGQIFSADPREVKKFSLLKIDQQIKYFGGAMELESEEEGGTAVDLIIPQEAFITENI
jgi:signal transduction histidine kinase